MGLDWFFDTVVQTPETIKSFHQTLNTVPIALIHQL